MPADTWSEGDLIAYVRRSTAEIDRNSESIAVALRNTAQLAWFAGLALAILKDRVGHGKWLPWRAQNIPDISERAVRNYMRIYTHWSNRQSIADLSVAKALRMIQAAYTAEPAAPSSAGSPRIRRLPGADYEPPPEPIDATSESEARDTVEAICQRLSLDDIGTIIARRIMAGMGDSEIAKELTRRASEVPTIHERIKAVATEIGLG